ncbi:MAG: MotB family protein [Chelatococcus sp.]|nr:MAG: MotB family protein [Chelatococcus sp.]
MMSKDVPDILVIRRRHGKGAETLKGGVWKIAYADFMTAMMALFLVLWLVNATNRETRTTVAQYFNPIKLSDTTADRKGVRNPQDAEPGDSENPDAIENAQKGAPRSGPEHRPTAVLKDPNRSPAPFDDPYSILAEPTAARKAEAGADRAAPVTLGTTGKPGLNGGEALRDPFDPDFWRQTPQAPRPVPAPEAAASEARTRKAIADAAAAQAPAEPRPEPTVPPPAASPANPPAAVAMTPRNGTTELASAITPRGETGAAASQAGAGTGTIASAIAAAFDGKGAAPRAAAPQVDVRQTDEGVLISLTDKANFGMFAIGSAEPHPETVEAMRRVAGVLGQRQGAIVIRGHTDARPFRARDNDNWRLSTARAHIAQDLLIQNGVGEDRISHIEGYASRLPRAADPNAAENRRIEILIRERRS